MSVVFVLAETLKTTVEEEAAAGNSLFLSKRRQEVENNDEEAYSEISIEGEVGSSFTSLTTQNYNNSSSSLSSLDVLLPNDFIESAGKNWKMSP